jgi:Na+/H+-dicarboxylate symporter
MLASKRLVAPGWREPGLLPMYLPITTEPSMARLVQRLSGFVRARLWLQVLVAMVAGMATGMAIGPTGGWLAPDTAQWVGSWLAVPGQLFLAMVQMIVIPLVVASIILGMTSSRDPQQLRAMGLRTGLFFLFTTVVAALIGLAVALVVQPGGFLQVSELPAAAASAGAASSAPSLSTLPAQIVRIVPTNPLQASVEQNMLQVVVFAVFVGVALVTMDSKLAKPLVDLLGAVQEVSMVVVRWAMYLVPAAVFGLLTQLTARMGLDALLGMGIYVVTVIGALLVAFAFLMAIYAVGRRRSPLSFLRGSRDVLLLAFSTSSSAAVMPLTIRTAEEALGVRPGVSRFVIPLGTTINMAGTALYQVMATLFLAQVYQVEVGLPGLLLVVVLAVGASIGSPGTPGVGIVILAMMLGTVGIPAEGMALIIGVDRILDMSRTTLNVAGDLVAASVIDQRMSDSALAPGPAPVQESPTP